MANWLKYVIAFTLAMALMLLFRTLAFSIHGVEGDGLAPLYQDGDRLLVNRCSYGVRIEGGSMLPYSRLMRQPVQRGDIVAFTAPCGYPSATTPDASQPATTPDGSPSATTPDGFPSATTPDGFPSGLMIARCTAVPGDTIRTTNGTLIVPGLVNCAKADYYWIEALNSKNPVDSRHLGFIPEQNIIGKVVTVLYNRKNTLLP